MPWGQCPLCADVIADDYAMMFDFLTAVGGLLCHEE